ncbi:MAG: hypothetical protein RBS43_05175 [Candidatus Cloacimonas sp.]|jgi:hypothetical protein|nr:hypothetical protein [Candidatus Cloacimonas sp.]
MRKVILCIIALAAMFSLVEAAPFQTLGMLRTPDAYVLPHKAAEILLVGYYRDVAHPSPVTDGHKGWFPYGMVGVGILDRVELGFFAGDNTEKDGLVYFMNAKVKVLEEGLRIPQISVGMDNIFSPVPKHGVQFLNSNEAFSTHPDADSYEYYSPYIVGSKQAVLMGIPWMFNLGVGTNRFVGQVARSKLFNGVFSSIEMSPLRDLTIQGEYDGEDFNAGIKYSIKNWGIKVGASALEDLAKNNGYEDNLRMAVGLSYLFDKYAEAKRRPDLMKFAAEALPEDIYTYQDETAPVVNEEGIVIPPTDIFEIGPDGEVVSSSTSLQTPGLVTQGSGEAYKELSPEVQDLLKELTALKDERKKAQQAMDELRKWIQELKKPKN